MQTKQQWFLDFMGQPNTQFTIPVYQRVYSWQENQCEELWEDIMRCGEDQVSHFMSMTLYLESPNTKNGLRKLDIIDGQQRIASTMILLTALRDYLRETKGSLKMSTLANQNNINGELEQRSRQDEVLSVTVYPERSVGAHPYEEGGAKTNSEANLDADALHKRFLVVQDGNKTAAKIQLIGPDKATLSALVLETEMPERASIRVKENYAYFFRRMHEEDFDAQRFWRGVRELLIIAAELDEGDKAQTIFEGLNTKGIPLTAADLMRNYLLVGESREEQQRLYKEYWQPMEIMFEDDLLSSGSLKLNTGLRMWLAIRFKRMCISDRSRTYYYFKLYMETEYDGTVEELLDEIRSFSYLWSANYECIGGRTHCSKFDWAKKGKRKTLVPPMSRAADVTARVRKSREEVLLEQMGQDDKHASEAVELCPAPTFQNSPAGYEITTFGRWGDNPIQWRVLERTDKQALLIAEDVIDCAPYHHHYVTITWAESYLREWANNDFFAGAFSSGEAARMTVNTTHTPDDELWETVGGADSEDHVWLLSKEEAAHYFADSDDRRAKPTDFAVEQNVGVENGYCLWWLRSPGHGQGFASTIWPVGGIDTAGSGVGRPGVGFRPVIRIEL